MTPRNSRLLVIDEDPSILTTFRIALEKEGCEIATESSPDRGFRRALSENFDLIILIRRKSGELVMKLIVELRNQGCLSQVLLVDIDDSPFDSPSIASLPCVSYESKQLEPQTLRDAVERALFAHEQGSAQLTRS